eukprot:537791-Lingulodinium_polyedra.AAC.1
MPEDGTEKTTTMEQIEMHVEPQPGLDPPDLASKTTDYWTREGNKWTRQHAIPRLNIIGPRQHLM